MSIYAIADLHLSFSPAVDKPMDIYGDRWYDHSRRLKDNWCRMITDDDTVIVPGDISWGLKLEDAKYDLDWVDSLPGNKIFFKGNHDLWWNGIKKLNNMYDSITFLQNDFYEAEGIYICGSRGWLTPDNDDFGDGDERIYKRELMRLETSVLKAYQAVENSIKKEMSSHDEPCELLGVMHYPPVAKPSSFSGFQSIFEKYGVKHVIYGHIHGADGFKNTIIGDYHGIRYDLVSLDYLNCKPLLIKE